MVLIHLGTKLFTLRSSFEQIPVNLVRRRVGRWSVIECDFHDFGAGYRLRLRIVGRERRFVVVGIHFHPERVLRAGGLV